MFQKCYVIYYTDSKILLCTFFPFRIQCNLQSFETKETSEIMNKADVKLRTDANVTPCMQKMFIFCLPFCKLPNGPQKLCLIP